MRLLRLAMGLGLAMMFLRLAVVVATCPAMEWAEAGVGVAAPASASDTAAAAIAAPERTLFCISSPQIGDADPSKGRRGLDKNCRNMRKMQPDTRLWRLARGRRAPPNPVTLMQRPQRSCSNAFWFVDGDASAGKYPQV